LFVLGFLRSDNSEGETPVIWILRSLDARERERGERERERERERESTYDPLARRQPLLQCTEK